MIAPQNPAVPPPRRRPSGAVLAALVVAGLVIAGVLAFAVTRGGDTATGGRVASSSAAGIGSTTPTPTPTGNEGPTRTSTDNPSASPPVDPQAVAAEKPARAFVIAYTQRRYTDSGAGAWVARAAPYATAKFAASLHARYDHAADATWTELVRSRTNLSTTVISARVDPGFHAVPDLRLVRVQYTTVRAHGSTAVPGTEHRAGLSLFMSLVAGHWLVSDVISTG